MAEFADRLRRVRESKGLTRFRLARLAGLSHQGVINLEVPGNDPRLSTVEKVARALGVGVADLLGVAPPAVEAPAAPARPMGKRK